MFQPQDLCGTLANDDAGSHRVAGCHAWHDGPIRDTKVCDTIDFEFAINHRHGVLAHLGGAGLVPVARGSIADKVLQFGTFQVAWYHLALSKRSKCGGVAYLAAEFHTGYRGLQVVWVR
jgi:hypothetical protein